MMKRIDTRWLSLTVAALLTISVRGSAQTDEIQVYDGHLATVGQFNLTLHDNYVANGLKDQPFPGAVVANHSWNGVPEWAYGVTKFWEEGLYMPLYSRDPQLGWAFNGFKVRELFAVPNADDRKFFYGINFETSYNAKRWDDRRITQEVRPIIGWHLDPVDIIVNPIMDSKFQGGLKGLDFVPVGRIAYNANKVWAIAAEEYDDYGEFGNHYAGSNQVHQLFAVADHTGGPVDVEAGVGFGLTNATDKLTFKLILSRDLNKRK